MIEKREKVMVVITGGTIDSEWNYALDTATPGTTSIVPKYLKRVNLDYDLKFEIACLKDSRSMEPKDMKNVTNIINKSKCNKFLVTHGTYTMPDTARYVDHHLIDRSKSVVFTGSIIPLRDYYMSDASFNLGFAFAVLGNMQGGVVVSMHGRTFKPQEIAKNMLSARFYSINS